jgi:hypothetical protein
LIDAAPSPATELGFFVVAGLLVMLEVVAHCIGYGVVELNLNQVFASLLQTVETQLALKDDLGVP